MVPPDSRGIARVPRYSGTVSRAAIADRLPDYHRLWWAFPGTFAGTIVVPRVTPETAPQPRAYCYARFGLFRVRSPLLTESRLISLPAGTEMFHFPAFASPRLWIGRRMTVHYHGRVSPFGNLRINACLAAPRSFSQLATSFIAYSRQGIHRVPLVA